MRRKVYAKPGTAAVRARRLRSLEGDKFASLALSFAMQLGFGALGFLLERAPLTKTIFPLGLAFVAGVNSRFALSSALGFMLSSWLGGAATRAVYISSAGVCMAVRFIVSKKQKSRVRMLRAAVTASTLSLMLSRLSVAFLSDTLDARTAALVLCEAALIAALAEFFSMATALVSPKAKKQELSTAQKLALCVSGFCVAAALCPVQLSVISAGRALCAFTAMLLCLRAPELALPCGVFFSAAIACTAPEYYFSAIGLAVACGAGTLFARGSKTALTLAFTVCDFAAALIAGDLTFALVHICEVSLSAAVFMLLPVRALPVKSPEAVDSAAVASARLNAISLSFGEIAALLKKRCSAPGKREAADKLINSAATKVCRGCALMQLCWVTHYDDTMECLHSLAETLAKRGSVRPEDLGPALCDNCKNPVSLCRAFNEGYPEVRSAMCRDRSVISYRAALQRQFYAVSRMIELTNTELLCAEHGDEAVGARLRDAAKKLGMEGADVQFFRNPDRPARLALRLRGDPGVKLRAAFTQQAQQLTGCRLGEAQVTLSDEGVCIEYCEKPGLTLRTACFQNGGRKACGDTYCVFPDAFGGTHIVLADGMGTGENAAAESAVCCAFMRRLLENRFMPAAAAGLINAVLSVRDGSESAITVDCLSFDGYSGAAQLMKAGAAPTWLWQDGSLSRLDHPSLPVGIMDDVCSKTYSLKLRAGDTAVMATDGASSACSNIGAVLAATHEQSPSEILSEIKRAGGDFDACADDATVIVVRAELNI